MLNCKLGYNPAAIRTFAHVNAYVTDKGFLFNTQITQMTFNTGFIWLPEPWREPPE